MFPERKTLLLAGLVVSSFFNNSAIAAYLDFTDRNTVAALTSITNGFQGAIDGIGFTLTSTDGLVNFNESYDGSTDTGCQSGGGPLACDTDGAGIGNDEITGLSVNSGQVLSLVFDTQVRISSLDFLDLYLNPDPQKGGEQARITVDGATLYTVNATGTSGDGGYANLDLLSMGGPIVGQTIEFTAFLGASIQDDRDNDYAFAAAEISAIPVPAAIWLFGTAIVGLIGFGKRKRTV